MNQKIARIAIVTGILLLAAGSATAQTAPSVGSATTSITLVDLSVGADGVAKDLAFGFGNGVATIDPSRVGLSRPTAQMSFAPLQGVDSSVEELLAIGAKAEKCDVGEEDCTYQDADTLLNIVMPTAVSQTAVGALEIGAIAAQVAGDGLDAFTNLSEVEVDADLETGLTLLEDVTFGIVNNANTTEAFSSQGISVGAVSVFSVGQMLDQLGMPMEFVADMAALGEAVGLPASTTDPLRKAEADYQQVEADEAAWLGAIAVLSDGDITNDGPALAAISGFATEYSSEISQCVSSGSCSSGDPTDSAVAAATTALAKTALQSTIDSIRDSIGGKMASLPLLRIEGLTIGVSSEALDTTAANSALFDWEHAYVLNVEVPRPADIDAQIDEIERLVEEAVNSIGSSIGVEMGADLELATTNLPAPVKDGSYWTATAGLTLVSLDVDAQVPDTFGPAAFSSGGGFSPSATMPASMGTRVLSLNAYSEHTPQFSGSVNDDDNDGNNNNNLGGPGPNGNGNNGLGGPGGSGSGSGSGSGGGSGAPLANTGIQSFLTIGGIAFVALALKLRRWLGDAA